jgi:bacillithiol biosynthesis deacetylase BshB1
MKLDILAFGAHPDDVELSCSGTLIKAIKTGKKAGIIDLTSGQLGTRGTPEIRLQEALKAKEIIGASSRDNLGMMDGYFENNIENREKIITVLRKYRPEIVLANAPYERHPDHVRASAMVSDACFYAGLRNISTTEEGKSQEPFRPKSVLYYMQNYNYEPSFVIDISDEMDNKIEAIKAFKSQFYNPDSKEPETILSSPRFLEQIMARNSAYGFIINTRYAEGFMTQRKIFGVSSIFEIL